MHYQFNNITGRLIGNQNFTPYFPVGATPLSKVEAPRPVFATANQAVAVETVRSSSSAAAKRIPGTSEFYSEVPASIRQRMELFQRQNGVPIHLKGGVSDRLLFGATVGLCLIGIAGVFAMIIDMSFPKKKK